MFAVDFSTTNIWKKYVIKYPSLLNGGSRYYKKKALVKDILPHDDCYKHIYEWSQLFWKKGEVISEY